VAQRKVVHIVPEACNDRAADVEGVGEEEEGRGEDKERSGHPCSHAYRCRVAVDEALADVDATRDGGEGHCLTVAFRARRAFRGACEGSGSGSRRADRPPIGSGCRSWSGRFWRLGRCRGCRIDADLPEGVRPVADRSGVPAWIWWGADRLLPAAKA
jgi:hypothetical protein